MLEISARSRNGLTHSRRGHPRPLYLPSNSEISFHLSGGMSSFTTLIVKHLAQLLTASIKDLRTNRREGGQSVRFRLRAGSVPLQDPAAGRRALTHKSVSGAGQWH